MDRPLRWLGRLDRLALLTGHGSAWLSLLLVLTVVAVVALRYGLGMGSIALQELALYLHGALLMLGMAYTLALDEHVRVDIFYRRLSAARRGLVDLLGTLFLLIPLCVAMLILSWQYVWTSWGRLEGSPDPGGLPAVFVLKTLLLVTPLLLLIQALAEGLRGWLRWRHPELKSETLRAEHD